MKVAFLCLLLLACTTATKEARTYPTYWQLDIVSRHWGAREVRMYCRDGGVLMPVTDIRMNHTTHVAVRWCPQVRFEIVTSDHILYRLAGWYVPRSHLTLIIGEQLYLSSIWLGIVHVRKAGTAPPLKYAGEA